MSHVHVTLASPRSRPWLPRASGIFPRLLALCLAASGVREGQALIVGRDAESRAAEFEQQGDFRQAAVWRLAAARAFEELILPFEQESVRAFSQRGQEQLAQTCSRRAEVTYPAKVVKNRQLFEEDLRRAGGAPVRPAVEREATAILALYAPVPLAVPSRLRRVEDHERSGNWHDAADCRELAARMFFTVTVPFFERESKRAPDPETRERFAAEARKYLQLARQSFDQAAEDYRRAAQASAPTGATGAGQDVASCQRKTAEREEQARQLAELLGTHP